MPLSTSDSRIVMMNTEGEIVRSKTVPRLNNPNIKAEGNMFKRLHGEIVKRTDRGETIPCVGNINDWAYGPETSYAREPWNFNADRNRALDAAAKCGACPLFDQCAQYRDSIQWPEGVLAGMWCFPASSRRQANEFRHGNKKGYEIHVKEMFPFDGCKCENFAHEIPDYDPVSTDMDDYHWNMINHGSFEGRVQHKSWRLPLERDGVRCDCVKTPTLHERRRSAKKKITRKA